MATAELGQKANAQCRSFLVTRGRKTQRCAEIGGRERILGSGRARLQRGLKTFQRIDAVEAADALGFLLVQAREVMREAAVAGRDEPLFPSENWECSSVLTI